MYRSKISELERTVDSLLGLYPGDDLPVTDERIIAEAIVVRNRCAELRKRWLNDLLNTPKEQIIRRFVQYEQACLVRLSDRISDRLTELRPGKGQQKESAEALRSVTGELERTLEFLQRHFYRYFDTDHRATIHYCRSLQDVVAGYQKQLNSGPTGSVDASLIDLVFASVLEVLEEGTIGGISYRQAGACLNLSRMVYQLIAFGTDIDTSLLARSLYRQNLNSLSFSNWYRSYLTKSLAATTDQDRKIGQLREQLRELEDVFVNPDKALRPEIPAIDVNIISWLRHQLVPDHTIADTKRPPEQFPLNVSVPQFAVFIRVFQKTGCFPIENVAMITRFFTAHFTTKKQPHISHKSFGRAFYELDQSAAAVVRDLLQKMLNYLNKTYFP